MMVLTCNPSIPTERWKKKKNKTTAQKCPEAGGPTSLKYLEQ